MRGVGSRAPDCLVRPVPACPFESYAMTSFRPARASLPITSHNLALLLFHLLLLPTMHSRQGKRHSLGLRAFLEFSFARRCNIQHMRPSSRFAEAKSYIRARILRDTRGLLFAATADFRRTWNSFYNRLRTGARPRIITMSQRIFPALESETPE